MSVDKGSKTVDTADKQVAAKATADKKAAANMVFLKDHTHGKHKCKAGDKLSKIPDDELTTSALLRMQKQGIIGKK